MCRRWLQIREGGGIDPEELSGDQLPDWTSVERLAYAHGVEPLLFSVLTHETACGAPVPEALRRRWEAAYYGNRLRNIDAVGLLGRIAATSEARGAPVMGLKGPAAIAGVYGDLGLRVMADLDLLCHREDLLTVTRSARAEGFTGGQVYVHHVLLEFGGPGGGYCEIHFTIQDVIARREAFIADAWLRRTQVLAEGVSLPVMPLEHQIVFDVGHMVNHGYEMDLKHAMDLAGRLRLSRHEIRWNVLFDWLAATELTRSFWLLVRTLEQLLRLPLVDSCDGEPSPEEISAFADQLMDWSASLGLARPFVLAPGVRRRQTLLSQGLYAWRRMCPPLVALQAARDIPTRARAAADLPRYWIAVVTDVVRRSSRGPR